MKIVKIGECYMILEPGKLFNLSLEAQEVKGVYYGTIHFNITNELSVPVKALPGNATLEDGKKLRRFYNELKAEFHRFLEAPVWPLFDLNQIKQQEGGSNDTGI